MAALPARHSHVAQPTDLSSVRNDLDLGCGSLSSNESQTKVLASSRCPATGTRNSMNFFKVGSVGKRRSLGYHHSSRGWLGVASSSAYLDLTVCMAVSMQQWWIVVDES